jgi:hypothetical protein
MALRGKERPICNSRGRPEQSQARRRPAPATLVRPRGVRNLLVAGRAIGGDGRAIGGDRIAHAATRNMACCAVTGQAAGIAAALSVRTGQSFHDLDTGLIQAELDQQGVRCQ